MYFLFQGDPGSVGIIGAAGQNGLKVKRRVLSFHIERVKKETDLSKVISTFTITVLSPMYMPVEIQSVRHEASFHCPHRTLALDLTIKGRYNICR